MGRLRTVGLAEDLQGKDLVLVAALCILQTHQPDARKGASAQRLDQLKVLLAQHLGRVPHDLLLRIDVDLVRAERVLLGLPPGQRLLLLLAWAVHGLVAPVVQRAGVVRLFLVAHVLARVEQTVHRGGRVPSTAGWCRRRRGGEGGADAFLEHAGGNGRAGASFSNAAW